MRKQLHAEHTAIKLKINAFLTTVMYDSSVKEHLPVLFS